VSGAVTLDGPPGWPLVSLPIRVILGNLRNVVAPELARPSQVNMKAIPLQSRTESLSGSEAPVTSFEVFFAEQRDRLMAQAYAMTASFDMAEDMVQEVIVRAWRHWEQVSRMERPGAWARKVLENLVIDNWRSRAIRRKVVEVNETVQPPDVGHVDIARALRRIPDSQRMALVLHDVIGLSVAEVAFEMNCPEGSVRAWLSRGRKALAELITNSPVGDRSEGKRQ